MASRQVGIVLSIPVHVERSHQAAKIDVQKVGNVSKETATERGLWCSMVVHKMVVSCHIQAFISRHTQPKQLITLTEKECADPHHVKQGIEISPGYPRCTVRALCHSIPHPIRIGTACLHIIDSSSIDVPKNHPKQEKQVPKEVHMISYTNTVLHPGTMVIKLGYTSITNRTVFWPDRFP